MKIQNIELGSTYVKDPTFVYVCVYLHCDRLRPVALQSATVFVVVRTLPASACLVVDHFIYDVSFISWLILVVIHGRSRKPVD